MHLPRLPGGCSFFKWFFLINTCSMLNAIIGFSIRNKLVVGLAVLGLLSWGSYELTRLPIDAVPDITNNQVQVITVAPSFGATDIERLVTFPVEQSMSNIHGLEEMRSFSRFGLSLVTLVFTDDTDVYWARQQVSERLVTLQSQIPDGIGKPELGPVTTGLGEIYQYMVRAAPGYESRYSITDLRTIQDWLVRRQLLRVEGVAEVSSFGGKLRQLEIALDPAQLAAHGVSVAEVFDAVSRNNQNSGGAYIERGPSAVFIRSDGLVGSAEDLEKIVVRGHPSGPALLLRELGQVREGYATRFGAMCYNDEGEVAGAIVMMTKGANSSEVISKVKNRIVEIRRMLPEGVIVEPFLDRTKMVNNAIHTVEKNLLEGALIVVFILVIFLGNIRAGLLVASIIPLSMLFAVILMNTFGVSGNLMSLGALDFGLIVDGAVIIVEAVLHQLAMRMKPGTSFLISRKEMDQEVGSSAGRMMNSAAFGQVIILVVYLPILSLEGIEGKMFKPMAQTVAFALLGAFLLSLTYVPMMASLVLSRKVSGHRSLSDRIIHALEARYAVWLIRSLRHPRMILSGVVVLFAMAIFTLSRMGGEFIPTLEEGDFAVDTRVLTGSSLTHTIGETQKAAGVLLARFPEVEKVVTKIGSGEVPTDPMPMEASDMMVILKDKSEWTSAHTFPELEKKMGEALADVPGISTGFQFPVQMRFNELMTGARQDVVCKIFGEDLDTLAALAARLGSIISDIEGAADLYLEPVTGVSQVVVHFDRDAVARYGLDIESLNRDLSLSMAGAPAGLYYEGEKRFDIVVRLAPDDRSEVEDVSRIPVQLPGGGTVTLGNLALVEVGQGPNQIQRENAQRRIVVGFNVRGRDVQTVVSELRQRVERDLLRPSGYSITYGGVFENLVAARKRLSVAVPVALLLIFFLLYFAFHSIRQGLLIFSAIPLSAIGGIGFLALRGMPFSISAGIGFIALFGVAVLNGIVLLAEFNRRASLGTTNRFRIALSGARTRLRPVLMTALVASLGFLPMAISNGAGAEVQRPLATVVIGGLALATLLTLFVLPALYAIKPVRLRIRRAPGALFLLVLLGLMVKAEAQTPWTLDMALDSARSFNLSVRESALRTAGRQSLEGTAFDPGPLSVSLDYGQYNSVYMDNRVGIAQSFPLPPLVAARREWLRYESEAISAQEAIVLLDVRKEVSRRFQEVLLLDERIRLWNGVLEDRQEAARILSEQAKAGAAHALDDALASTAAMRMEVACRELISARRAALESLRLAIGVAATPARVSGELLMTLTMRSDSTISSSHPALAEAREWEQAALARERVERQGRWPVVTLGFSSTSITGIGADDVYYPVGRRFNTAFAGLDIPLAGGAQRSRIRAAKVAADAAGLESERRRSELEMARRLAAIRFEQSIDALAAWNSGQLARLEELRSLATTQFRAGVLSVADWAVVHDHYLQVYDDYFQSVRSYNEAVLELQYLTQP